MNTEYFHHDFLISHRQQHNYTHKDTYLILTYPILHYPKQLVTIVALDHHKSRCIYYSATFVIDIGYLKIMLFHVSKIIFKMYDYQIYLEIICDHEIYSSHNIHYFCDDPFLCLSLNLSLITRIVSRRPNYSRIVYSYCMF